MNSKSISKTAGSSSSSSSIDSAAAVGRKAVYSCLVVTVLLLGMPGGPVAADVSLEIGVEGNTVQENTETPNLERSGTEEADWSKQTAPMELESVPVEVKDLEAPMLTDFMNGYMHLLRSPLNIGRGIDTPPDTVEQALAPPAAGIGGTPTDSKTFIATRDGPVTLQVYLRTYNPAKYAVRVYRPDGSEMLFNGKPFLLWERPDDKSYSPLFFKGREVPNSMVQAARGDYSPARGLRYVDRIRRGFKVVLETYGDVESGSFLNVDSPAF